MSTSAIKVIRFFADPLFPEWTGQSLQNVLTQQGFSFSVGGAGEKTHAIAFGLGAYQLFKEIESMPERFSRLILIAPELKTTQPISSMTAMMFGMLGASYIKKSAIQFRVNSQDAFLKNWKIKRAASVAPISGSLTLAFNGLCVFGDKDDRVDAGVQENEIKRVAPAIKIEEIHGAKHDLMDTHTAKIVEMILRELKN
ncbi:MAG: hypothetical protein KA715_14025 [Xanthomonadaceae bacterium]|nr:hypothetical protein [Xanthomonadaceae bacterium]